MNKSYHNGQFLSTSLNSSGQCTFQISFPFPLSPRLLIPCSSILVPLIRYLGPTPTWSLNVNFQFALCILHFPLFICDVFSLSRLTTCDLRFSMALAFPFHFALFNLHFDLLLLFAPWSMRFVFSHSRLRTATCGIYDFSFCTLHFAIMYSRSHDSRLATYGF